jgi:Concanavalin A-like lectin/glucanases superfamily/Right handed beta helix region
MKKSILLFALLVLSFCSQAQITQYIDFNKQDFYGLGGYTYTEQNFPAGVQAMPYVRTGPSPQNDFQYVATATGGIKNLSNAISTTNVGATITLKMKNNNVRKFGANVITKTPDGSTITGEAMILSVYTNQGNGQTYIFSNSSITWMGLVATGQNEYIDSVKVSYLSASTNVITIGDIMVGDNQAQNVSINFDGVNDHVTIPSNVGNFASNAVFTVSCWVKPATLQNDLVNTDVEILEKWDGTTAAYPFVIRYLNENIANGANVGKIVAARYNGIAAPSIMSSVSIDDNKWHHIAFVVDALGMHLYIDGISVTHGNDFTPTQANTPCTNNSPLYVGSRNNINHFKGEIDEVRLWTVGKTQTEILNEMRCKNPNTTNLQAAYNFNNGVPNGNNALITQVQDAVGTNHGILSGFAKTGDASNFVTGQVKYVKADAAVGNDGSSWTNAYPFLQYVLPSSACNDLFDIYVAKGVYKPSLSNDINDFFNISVGMKLYGGFAGTEKNINERNKALIHSTNKSTLSGDEVGNDPEFSVNSVKVVKIVGGYVNFDGFTVRGGQMVGILKEAYGDVKISNCRIIDNRIGLELFGANSTITDCVIAANTSDGISIDDNSSNFQNCLIVNNAGSGIYQVAIGTNIETNLINCTIAANGTLGISNYQELDHPITNTIKNTIIKDNASGGISGTATNSITYSLVQGISTGTGNLNGNTVNPQFVSPIANNVLSDAGDYRLKWCSLAIGAGNNTGITPLDLDRNPRRYRTNVDMGAYEHMGNTPTGANPIDISYTIDIPNYSGVGVQRITSAAKILAPAGKIDFKAPNSITLNPGFEARGMSNYFQAQIGANQTCVN